VLVLAVLTFLYYISDESGDSLIFTEFIYTTWSSSASTAVKKVGGNWRIIVYNPSKRTLNVSDKLRCCERIFDAS